MTESEAIEVINSNRPTSGYVLLNEALGTAINALEKQIPIKPMISYDERVKENWCSCGVCCSGFGRKRTIHYKYCPDCGQKLDWIDED